MIDLVMPQLGEDVAEATVQQWLVQEGAYLQREQNVLVVSTDKADIEIPSPCDGGVVAIVAPVGAKVPTEGLLARIDDSAA